jgi:hypothetical protein
MILVIELNYITEAAIYCEGGAEKVDHNVVIGLLKDILVLLVTLLAELKAIVKVEGCDLNVLSGLVAGLLIVRIFIDHSCLTPDVPLLGRCRNPLPRYRSCWYR